MISKLKKRVSSILIAAMVVTSVSVAPFADITDGLITGVGAESVSAAVTTIPTYNGSAYVSLNDGEPEFSSSEKKRTDAFETYSNLDSKGRCGVAYANICEEIMPTTERGDISSIHPTGWQSGVGYNRCHLIGYQLAGENANPKNLITGTQYFNVSGMLPFENMIADYVEETGNHVLYRVTPVFKGNDLVARGVQMEAWSVEDKGDGICFNIFCFNVFKGNTPRINYTTGNVNASKQEQKVTASVLSKLYTVKKSLGSAKTFSMNIKTSSGNKYCTKNSGSKNLSVSSKGTVTVKKGTPIGKYTMSVKIYAEGNSKYKAKTVYRTVTVTVKKFSTTSGSGTVYWTPTGECYHKTSGCRSLSRSKNIISGSLSKANGLRACKICC